jgi:ABC-type Mn2+/Zn2+ transport system permease subunit
MSWLVEPFQFAFMQRAALAGVLVVVVTALVGTWVVLRGLSFLGEALAHGVLPGLAVATLVGFNPLLGAALSALVMVGGINLVHRRSRLSEDTGIGLLFVGMLALGVIIISRSQGFASSLTGILFGDALGVGAGDLWLLAVVAVITLLLTVFLWRPFLALSFNEDKAELLGMRPRLANVALLVLITLAVVASFRTAGTLLVYAMLVAPPATGALLARRLPAMVATAVVVGVVSVFLGLLVSYHAGTAASATVAGTAVAIFFIGLLVTRRAGAGL